MLSPLYEGEEVRRVGGVGGERRAVVYPWSELCGLDAEPQTLGVICVAVENVIAVFCFLKKKRPSWVVCCQYHAEKASCLETCTSKPFFAHRQTFFIRGAYFPVNLKNFPTPVEKS